MDCSRAVGCVVPMGDGEEFGGEEDGGAKTPTVADPKHRLQILT